MLKALPLQHGGESRGMNDRVHGISCRFSDQTGKEIAHIFLNIKSIFMQKSAYTFALFQANTHLRVVLLCAEVFSLKSKQIIFSAFRLCLDLCQKLLYIIGKIFKSICHE